MYKSKEDKISETVLGEAVLLLLEEQTPITVDTLYQRLQAQLLDERYELRRSGIITALWDLHSLTESTLLKQDNSHEMQDIAVDSEVIKH